MRIGGLQKFSLIDYPGVLACVIFTQGCNFRCRYCHNPELVIPEKFCPVIPEEEVINFLKRRQQYLEGVVVSGGEPTIQEDLLTFLYKIKCLGYLVKLDTNGSQPQVLRQLIRQKFINYIAMDVKAPLERYQEVVGVGFPVEKIKESIDIILESGIKHEFRTSVVKSLCSYEDICEIRHMLRGDQCFRLQRARLDEKVLDGNLIGHEQYSENELDQFKQELETKIILNARSLKNEYQQC